MSTNLVLTILMSASLFAFSAKAAPVEHTVNCEHALYPHLYVNYEFKLTSGRVPGGRPMTWLSISVRIPKGTPLNESISLNEGATIGGPLKIDGAVLLAVTKTSQDGRLTSLLVYSKRDSPSHIDIQLARDGRINTPEPLTDYVCW